MSRNSVIVLVSNSAIFTLCRAMQVFEDDAHSPFCLNLNKVKVGNLNRVVLKNTRLE